MTLSDAQLNWLAGFLEGEGSFAKCGRTISIQATQVNPEPILKIYLMCGGNIYTFSKPEIKSSSKGIYQRWDLYGPSALVLMKALYPLMSKKRQYQIDGALTFYKTLPHPGKKGGSSGPIKTHCAHGHELVGDNVYIYPGKYLKRKCLACQKVWSRNYNEKRKELFNAIAATKHQSQRDSINDGLEYSEQNINS